MNLQATLRKNIRAVAQVLTQRDITDSLGSSIACEHGFSMGVELFSRHFTRRFLAVPQDPQLDLIQSLIDPLIP